MKKGLRMLSTWATVKAQATRRMIPFSRLSKSKRYTPKGTQIRAVPGKGIKLATAVNTPQSR